MSSRLMIPINNIVILKSLRLSRPKTNYINFYRNICYILKYTIASHKSSVVLTTLSLLHFNQE